MKFLIVMPKFVNRYGEMYVFPVGLTYISAALKAKGYAIECLNLNHYDEWAAVTVRDKLRNSDFDVVCTGGISAHYHRIKQVLDAARSERPDIVTVVGGGLLSSAPELIMAGLGATFGVIGEGEETITDLAEALSTGEPTEQIPGLIYRAHDGRFVRTPTRAPIRDIDAIAYPNYDDWDVEKYFDILSTNSERNLYKLDNTRTLHMLSSRSCPFKCTFCYHPLGTKYRKRSWDGFFEEMVHNIEKYKVNTFNILDDLFSINRKRVEAFCAGIKPLNVRWSVQLRVDKIDSELLALMRDAGCYNLSYGLESGSETVLKSMKKRTTPQQISRALDLTYEAGIAVQGNFLFGDPSETPETVAETLGLWLKLRKHNIYLIPIEVYPGTEIFDHAVSKGVIPDRLRYIEEGCPLINNTTMSDADYVKVLLLAIILRKAYQKTPAKVLALAEEGRHPVRGPLYALKVACPHCGAEVTYRNMRYRGSNVLGCRECNRRFNIPSPLDDPDFSGKNRLAVEYTFSPQHVAEIRSFLDPSNEDWLVAQDINIEGIWFMIIKLFEQQFLVPQMITFDALKTLSVPVFSIDENTGETVHLD